MHVLGNVCMCMMTFKADLHYVEAGVELGSTLAYCMHQKVKSPTPLIKN